MPVASKFSYEGALEQPLQLRITIGSKAEVEFLPPFKALLYGYRYALKIRGKREILIGFPTVSDLYYFVSEVTAVFCIIGDHDEKFLFDCWEEDNLDCLDYCYD